MALETQLPTEVYSESSENRWDYVLNGTFSSAFYCVKFLDPHLPRKRYSLLSFEESENHPFLVNL